MIQPTKWSVPLGSGADVQDLPDDDLKYASFSKIFPQITQVPLPAGGVAPRRIDFNSLFKLLADNIYFYQNGGVFEYSDTADYEKGALVRYNDNIYLCVQDNSALNVHNPEEMDYWLRVALNNELADKANKDLSNVTAPTQAFKNMSVGWGVPDYTAGINILSGFTAPSVGYISVKPFDYSGVIYINDIEVMRFEDGGTGINSQTGYLLVDKNDVFTSSGNWQIFKFYPCKGAN